MYTRCVETTENDTEQIFQIFKEIFERNDANNDVYFGRKDIESRKTRFFTEHIQNLEKILKF